MVFGGTRIDGASNITRALARGPASEVANKITADVSTDQALETLSTAADKLLKGKRLAIYDRTSNNTPRFARQYLISHERATHTVAVVRSLFAKASAGVADEDTRTALRAELNEYLDTDNKTITGRTLKDLMAKVKAQSHAAAASQAAAQQPVVDGHVPQEQAEVLQRVAPDPQQASVDQAPEPDPPGQAPEPQQQQPMGLEKGVEWQGLPLASENERPRSQALPKPGELADPAIAPPENQPGPVSGQIEKAAEFTEEALAPAQGMAVEMDAELEEPLQFDPSFEESASHRQSAAGLGRLSGELLLQSFAGDQNHQEFMADDDADYQYDDFSRSNSISEYGGNEPLLIEDEDFDANALDRRSSIGRPASEDNSFIDDEDEQEVPNGQLGLRPSEQISPHDILAAMQAKEVAAKRAEAWSQFTNQLDEYTELVVEWQAEFGRLVDGDPGDLYSRPLGGLPNSLRAGMLKLEALLDDYDGRPTELSELRTLQRAVGGSAQRLNEGLGTLVAKRDALLEALESVREQFDLDEAAQEVVAQDLAQTDLILSDLELLLERSDSLQAAPDPEMVLQRQNDYQAGMLAYPDEALGKVKQAWAKLDLEGLASLQVGLKARLDSGKTDSTTLETIAQIRGAMKTQRESINRLQAELQSVRGDLSLVREEIVRDFGSTDPASQRMQAAVANRLNDVAQLRQELQPHLTGIDQALNRKVTLPAKVNAPASAPSNVEVAGLRRSLLNFKNGPNPQEDLQTYDQDLLKLLSTLGSGAALSRDQVNQLSKDLAAQGPVAGRLQDLTRILILTVTNARDEAITKVMTEHAKRTSDAQRQTQEAVRKKKALEQIIDQRAQRLKELHSQIRTLNQVQLAAGNYIDLQADLAQAQGDPEKVLDLQSKIQRLIVRHQGDETVTKLLQNDVVDIRDVLQAAPENIEKLESDLRLQLDGGLVPNTEGMSPEWAEKAQWEAMPLSGLEAELAEQDKAMEAAQTQQQVATREQKRATAILSQDAELKEAELQKGLGERLQDLATALEQLKAS